MSETSKYRVAVPAELYFNVEMAKGSPDEAVKARVRELLEGLLDDEYGFDVGDDGTLITTVSVDGKELEEVELDWARVYVCDDVSGGLGGIAGKIRIEDEFDQDDDDDEMSVAEVAAEMSVRRGEEAEQENAGGGGK